MGSEIEARARELLVAEWGEHPQWADVRKNILDGSCQLHSDPLNLACAIALQAITGVLEDCIKIAGDYADQYRAAGMEEGELACLRIFGAMRIRALKSSSDGAEVCYRA